MMRSAVIEGQRVLILSQVSFQHWQFHITRYLELEVMTRPRVSPLTSTEKHLPDAACTRLKLRPFSKFIVIKIVR